jgi:hypothetical protein
MCPFLIEPNTSSLKKSLKGKVSAEVKETLLLFIIGVIFTEL